MARISAFRTIQLDGNELRSQSYAIAGLRRDFAQEQWKNCTPAPVDSYENQLLLSSCHDVTAWLTLDADRAVGMAIIQPTSRYAEGRYVLVYVLPEFRSLGIGRALFSAVAAELSCRNIETFG